MEGMSRKPGVLGMVGGGNHIMCGNWDSYQGQRLSIGLCFVLAKWPVYEIWKIQAWDFRLNRAGNLLNPTLFSPLEVKCKYKYILARRQQTLQLNVYHLNQMSLLGFWNGLAFPFTYLFSPQKFVEGLPELDRILLGTRRRRGGIKMSKLGLYPPAVFCSMVETNVYTQIFTIEAKNVNTGIVRPQFPEVLRGGGLEN